jgi:hypothetical protein
LQEQTARILQIFFFFQGPPGQGGGAAIDHLKKDPELKPHLSQPDFQALVSELEPKPKAKAP